MPGSTAPTTDRARGRRRRPRGEGVESQRTREHDVPSGPVPRGGRGCQAAGTDRRLDHVARLISRSALARGCEPGSYGAHLAGNADTFAHISSEHQASWFKQQPALVTRTPRWTDSGRRLIWNARWSPDGTRVAASGADGTVSVYDAASGKVLVRKHPGPSAFQASPGIPEASCWQPVERTRGSNVRCGVRSPRRYVDGPRRRGHRSGVARTAPRWRPRGRTADHAGAGRRVGRSGRDRASVALR